MEFRTKVELPVGQWEIDHASRLMLWGSCFSEHIGSRLSAYKFNCDVNPYGILYNPLSIARALSELMAEKVYTPDDLICHNGEWHSLMHHGSFSSSAPEECLESINGRCREAGKHLAEATGCCLRGERPVFTNGMRTDKLSGTVTSCRRNCLHAVCLILPRL